MPVITTAEPDIVSVPVPFRPTANAPEGLFNASVPPLITTAAVELAPLAMYTAPAAADAESWMVIVPDDV